MANDTAEALSGKFNTLTLQENSSGPGRHTVIQPAHSFRFSTPVQYTLGELFKSVLQPTLESRQTFDRIHKSHPFFTRIERICQQNEWPDEKFENFRRLMCGIRDFPCILLQNPKNDDLEFNEMVSKTKSLLWIQETLRGIGLELDDVIIIDLFPLLTDEWLDNHPNERASCLKDMFQLTLDFVQEFKPPVILSCQCWKFTLKERWGYFENDDTEKLRSSMAGAKMQKLSGVYFDAHFTQVARAFHPAKLFHVSDNARSELEITLGGIFRTLFTPCASWKMEYKHRLEATHAERIQSVKRAVYTLRQRATEYDNTCEEGLALGLFANNQGSTTPEKWTALKSALDLIIRDISRASEVPL
jgi:hypothetical protein